MKGSCLPDFPSLTVGIILSHNPAVAFCPINRLYTAPVRPVVTVYLSNAASTETAHSKIDLQYSYISLFPSFLLLGLFSSNSSCTFDIALNISLCIACISSKTKNKPLSGTPNCAL